MGLLSTPETEMDDDERLLAEFLTMRLQQIDKGRGVMTDRIDSITQEQEDLKIRAEEFSRMVEEETESLSEGDDETTMPSNATDWYVNTAQEIEEEITKVGSRLEGAKTVIDQINKMQEVYVSIATAVDSGEMGLSEATNMINEAESNIEWLTDDHEYDLSTISDVEDDEADTVSV